ncbi:MAG: ABC transporter substrate-binding protein [Crenarchaeota archaeon]|nr:ABC transporter substrate-binding protein [Thermoproteota archaeon]
MARKSVIIGVAIAIIVIIIAGVASYIYLSHVRKSTVTRPTKVSKPTHVVTRAPTCKVAWPSVTVQYARLFKIINTGKYYLIVKDAANHTFILVPRGCPAPKNVSGIVIYVPVKRVVYFSTTEVALLYRIAQALHKMSMLKTVVGVTWRGVWWIPYMQELLNNGTTKYVGSSWEPNIEEILALDPDLVVMYTGFATMVQIMNKLEKAGLKVFVDNEWLEKSYIARFEWIKAIGALYGPEALKAAEEVFNSAVKTIEEVYDMCRGLPKVRYAWFVMYWGKFYVPGAESYVAKALAKMGGEYLFQSATLRRTGSATVSREYIDAQVAKAQLIVISGFPPYTTSLNPYVKALPDMIKAPALRTFRVFEYHPSYWQLGYAYTGKVILQIASLLHPEKFRGVYRTFFIPLYFTDKTMSIGGVEITWRGYYEIIRDLYGDKILIIPWGLTRQLKYFNPKVFPALATLEKDIKSVNAIVQTPVRRVVVYYTCARYIDDLGFTKSIIYTVTGSVNIGKIVSMHPDVVILDSSHVSKNIVDELISHKIPVIVLDCSNVKSGFIISLLYNYPDLGYMLFLK